MQRALVVSVLVGAVCAVLSCYLVLKGWSLMGDAISHAVLPGIVIAFVLGIPLAIGAFAAGLSCALLTGYLKENSRVKEDTVMGIVFSGMFGFGLVIFTKVETDQHLNHILFGNVLGVTVRDLVETAIIAGGTLLIVLVKRRDLLLYCFDPNHARAIGLPVRALHYGLLILLSLTIVGSLKAVGIILVIAMLVAPGAIAYLLTDSFERMLVIATAVATASSRARHASELPHRRRHRRLHRADADGGVRAGAAVRAEARVGGQLVAPAARGLPAHDALKAPLHGIEATFVNRVSWRLRLYGPLVDAAARTWSPPPAPGAGAGDVRHCRGSFVCWAVLGLALGFAAHWWKSHRRSTTRMSSTRTGRS